VAAGFTFLPKLIARAAEEYDFARALRFRQRRRIHEAEHEDVAGAVILNDRGNETACFVEVDVHGFQVRAPRKSSAENKKPAGANCASGPMSALCCETLCTPHRARRMAVMAMVAMRPRVHTKKIEKIVFGVNNGFFRESRFFRGRLAEPKGGGQSSSAAAWMCRPPGVEVHAHLQMDGYTGFAVFKLFHADDLGDVLAVHGVVG
jgi:hypothetical protein